MKERQRVESLQLKKESVSEILESEENHKMTGVKISPAGLDLLDSEDHPMTKESATQMIRGVAAHKVSSMCDEQVVAEIRRYKQALGDMDSDSRSTRRGELMRSHIKRLNQLPNEVYLEFQSLMDSYYFRKVSRGKKMSIFEGDVVHADEVERIWNAESTRNFLERVVRAEESLITDYYLDRLVPGEIPDVTHPVLSHATDDGVVIREEMRINNVTINRLDGSIVKFQLVTVPDLMFDNGEIIIIDKKFGHALPSISQSILYSLVAQAAFEKRGTKLMIELFEDRPPKGVQFYYQTFEDGEYYFSMSDANLQVKNPVTWVANKVEEYRKRESEMKKRISKRNSSIVIPYLPTNKQKQRMQMAQKMPQQPKLIYWAKN